MRRVLNRFVLIPKGEWKEDQVYVALDVVRYNGQGYVALKEVRQGLVPSDDKENWMLLVERGEQGAVFLPSVSNEGILSFDNNGGLENPKSVNLMGKPGKPGTPGKAGTIQVGSVVLTDPDTQPRITNSGTETDAVLNFTIPRGKKGEPGKDGRRGTVQIGSVGTGLPGTRVEIRNTGTDEDAILNFVIPAGKNGDDGRAATIRMGNVTTAVPGTPADVANSGTETDAVLNFTIPRGEKGEPGKDGRSVNILAELDGIGSLPPDGNVGDGYLIDGYLYVWNPDVSGYVNVGKIQGPEGKRGMAATVRVGNVITAAPGTPVRVTNSGTDTDAELNFTIPRGETGAKGDTPAIQIGYVAMADPDSHPGVTNSGTETDVVLNFTIPRGYPGIDGEDGVAASVQVGKIEKLTPGKLPTVTNSGTETNAILDFGIPSGETGVAGKPLVVDGFVDMLPPRPVPGDRYIIRPDIDVLYVGNYYLNCGRSSHSGFRIVGDADAVCPAPDNMAYARYADLKKGDVITGWIPVVGGKRTSITFGYSAKYPLNAVIGEYNEQDALIHQHDIVLSQRHEFVVSDKTVKLKIRILQDVQGGNFSFIKVFQESNEIVSHSRIYRWNGQEWVKEPVKQGLPVYVKGKEFQLRSCVGGFRKIEDYGIPCLEIVEGTHTRTNFIRLKNKLINDNYVLRFYCRRRRAKRIAGTSSYIRKTKYYECLNPRKYRSWPTDSDVIPWPQSALARSSQSVVKGAYKEFDTLELQWKDLFERVFVCEADLNSHGRSYIFWPCTGLPALRIHKTYFADFAICLAKKINGKLINGEFTYFRMTISNDSGNAASIRVIK